MREFVVGTVASQATVVSEGKSLLLKGIDWRGKTKLIKDDIQRRVMRGEKVCYVGLNEAVEVITEKMSCKDVTVIDVRDNYSMPMPDSSLTIVCFPDFIVFNESYLDSYSDQQKGLLSSLAERANFDCVYIDYSYYTLRTIIEHDELFTFLKSCEENGVTLVVTCEAYGQLLTSEVFENYMGDVEGKARRFVSGLGFGGVVELDFEGEKG